MNMVLYILKNSAGRFYVGVTSDLTTRLAQHNERTINPSRWTRYHGPWELVFSQEFSDASAARRAERFVKRMKSRTFIEKLIAGERILPVEF